MARETGPKLRREPLLGTCLAEMVSDGAEEAHAAAETGPAAGGKTRPADPLMRQRTKTAPADLAHETGKDDLASIAAARESSKRPSSSPFTGGGSKRATPEQLARLAGQKAKESTRRPPVARRPSFAQPKDRPAQPPSGKPATGQEWAGRLAARVRQRSLATAHALHADRPTPHPRPAPAERPVDLAAQWRELLDGPRVPDGWLTARPGQPGGLPTSRPPAADGRLRERGSDREARPSSPVEDRRRPALHPPLRGRRSPAGHHDDPTGAARGLSRPIPAGGDSDGWVGPGPDVDGASHRNGRLEADNGEVVSVVNRFAPPQMADTLPPLRPPVGLGSVAMPVAAAAVRRSAQREAAAVEDDLDELAGKLRRILEEESRRHGIDI